MRLKCSPGSLETIVGPWIAVQVPLLPNDKKVLAVAERSG